MEAEELIPLLEQLDDNIDDLDEVLKPLQDRPLTLTANRLPVLDKAKLHILTTYTLESLLFSYLRLQGVDIKKHPVSKELTRLRQYFDKIKVLETEPEKPNLTLDKAAAGRFIKHGLAGNDKIDLERAEIEAKERTAAQLKASMISRKDGNSQTHSTEPSSNNGGSDPDTKSDSGVENPTDAETAPETQPRKEVQSENPKNKKSKGKSETAKILKNQKSLGKQEIKKERRQKKKETRRARKENLK